MTWGCLQRGCAEGLPVPRGQRTRRLQLQDSRSPDPGHGHLLLLADLVEELHVLNHGVRGAVDAVVLGAEHGGDAGSVAAHEALHELHEQVPAVAGDHAGAVLHLQRNRGLSLAGGNALSLERQSFPQKHQRTFCMQQGQIQTEDGHASHPFKRKGKVNHTL